MKIKSVMNYNQNIRKLGLLFLLVSALFSCENVDQFIQYNQYHLSRPQLLSNWKAINPIKEVVEFNSSDGVEYTFDDFSKILIAPKSLQLDGKILEGKTLRLEVKRVFNKKQMVGSLISTNSGLSILESAGMFQVKVYYESLEVSLLPGKSYKVLIALDSPSEFNDKMELFYGEELENGMNWKEVDNNPNIQDNVVRSEWRVNDSAFVFGYEMNPNHLTWINCDYFLKFEGIARTEPCIQISSDPVGDDIKLLSFCVFEEYNSVAGACCESLLDGYICFNPIPVGLKVKYLVVGKGKQKYYFGMHQTTTKENQTVQIKILPKSEFEIKELINSL